MSYIIILDPNSEDPNFVTNSHGFIVTFDSYEAAKEEASGYMLNKDCYDYAIVVKCSDERNYLV